jgi:RNA polymerase sigma factor
MFRKWLSKRDKFASDRHSVPIEDELLQIQSGDDELRNDLLLRYQPFVARTASRFCHRYIHPETDDEFSVAFTAFNEAIDAYDAKVGRSFLSFAETVIRRRLTDFVRKERRFASQVPQSAFLSEDEDGETFDPIDTGASLERYQADRDSEGRMLEIETLHEQLQQFGISFADLVDGSPKHEDSRRSLIGIGVLISRDSSLSELLISRKTLPLKELADRVKVSRKTLERGRKYIIAVALIHLGMYPHLQSFVPYDADSGSGANAGNQRGRRWEA